MSHEANIGRCSVALEIGWLEAVEEVLKQRNSGTIVFDERWPRFEQLQAVESITVRYYGLTEGRIGDSPGDSDEIPPGDMSQRLLKRTAEAESIDEQTVGSERFRQRRAG